MLVSISAPTITVSLQKSQVSPPTDTRREVGNGSNTKIPMQKIRVVLAIISKGRYERAASTDANTRLPPVVLALLDIMLLIGWWMRWQVSD
jgi:hypothetical protein